MASAGVILAVVVAAFAVKSLVAAVARALRAPEVAEVVDRTWIWVPVGVVYALAFAYWPLPWAAGFAVVASALLAHWHRSAPSAARRGAR